ncbi:MAG: SRPBCC domain-containing protein [Burkholderiales bacterium]|nr:SRPBCC domain-containing protein [Burkholderiales bacterium]
MKKRVRAAALSLAAVLLAGGGPVAAATSEVSATGFLVTLRHEVRATPHQVWEALGQVDKWWNGSHSWSGSAANLSLSRQAGGCYCERWGANSVEHARVVHAAEDRLLRLQGSLGPLQALATTSVLSFALAPRDGGTTLVVTYRVAGNEAAGLQQLAGPVDGVIGEQVRRLVAYVETGKPD